MVFSGTKFPESWRLAVFSPRLAAGGLEEPLDRVTCETSCQKIWDLTKHLAR